METFILFLSTPTHINAFFPRFFVIRYFYFGMGGGVESPLLAHVILCLESIGKS